MTTTELDVEIAVMMQSFPPTIFPFNRFETIFIEIKSKDLQVAQTKVSMFGRFETFAKSDWRYRDREIYYLWFNGIRN